MGIVSLKASPRLERGKGAARKLRAKGMVPGVAYRGGADAAAVAIVPRDLELSFARTKNPNTLVELAFDDGSKRLCLVRDVQRHPVSAQIVHIDFYEVNPDEDVVVSVPLVLEGRAAGARAGGTLEQHIRRMSVRCRPQSIPDTLVADVTPLQIGDELKLSQIPAPAGVVLIYGADYTVAEVQGSRAEGEKAGA